MVVSNQRVTLSDFVLLFYCRVLLCILPVSVPQYSASSCQSFAVCMR